MECFVCLSSSSSAISNTISGGTCYIGADAFIEAQLKHFECVGHSFDLFHSIGWIEAKQFYARPKFPAFRPIHSHTYQYTRKIQFSASKPTKSKQKKSNRSKCWKLFGSNFSEANKAISEFITVRVAYVLAACWALFMGTRNYGKQKQWKLHKHHQAYELRIRKNSTWKNRVWKQNILIWFCLRIHWLSVADAMEWLQLRLVKLSTCCEICFARMLQYNRTVFIKRFIRSSWKRTFACCFFIISLSTDMKK